MVDNKNTIIKNISQWQCPTCGEMNDSNNSFCTNCGVKSVNLPLQAINSNNWHFLYCYGRIHHEYTDHADFLYFTCRYRDKF